MVSWWAHLFMLTILALLVITFVYRFIRSLFSDVTYTEKCLRKWKHHLPRSKTSLYTSTPVPGLYLSILFEPSPDPSATSERLRFIHEYLATTFPQKKFEVVLLASPDAMIPPLSKLREQFPSISLVHAVDRPAPVHAWAVAALKARGEFIVHSAHLEAELPKLPVRPNQRYLSFVDPDPTLLYFGGLDALVLAAAAKKAALALLASVHVTEFGLAEEYRLIAGTKALEMNVEKRKNALWEHGAPYWIVNKVAAIAVRWLYAQKLWSYR
jgi:hypothetical protein